MRRSVSLAVLACTWRLVWAQPVSLDQMFARVQAPPSVKTMPATLPQSPPAAATTVATPTPDTPRMDLGLGLGISTAGLSGHLSVPIAPRYLNARFGINYFGYNYSGMTDNIDFRFKLKLNTYDALLDWFPFGGNFRLTTGLVYNASQIDMAGRPGIASNYVINGHTYNRHDVGRLTGQASFPSFVSYIGFGYGNAVDTSQRWVVFSDTGVLLNSRPAARIRAGHCNAPAALCGKLEEDLDALNQSLDNGFRLFNFYPIMRIGVSYRF